MCGRFVCGLAPDVVRRLSTYIHSQTHQSVTPTFIDLMPSTRSFRQSWNIAPTSTCLCLISAKHLDGTEDSASRVLCSMRWALVPQYHKGNLNEFKAIFNNCRTETMEEKISFKGPWKTGQRCVVIAEGFFEWKENTSKTPFFVYQREPMLNEKNYPDVDVEEILSKLSKDDFPFLAMAGLFDINEHCDSQPIYSCTICTIESSETMKQIHHRMPVILNNQNEIDQWLDFGRFDSKNVSKLLLSRDDIQMHRVSASIGSTKINDMNNLRPINDDKTTSSMRNTLDAFVIRGTSNQYFDNRMVKKEEEKNHKRSQELTIDKYMYKDNKTLSVKRMKK